VGRDKEDTSNKTIKGHQKTALEQTISHMASGTQDEEPRRKNLKQGRILQWQHPHLLLIRRFAREESKKQRRKLQWQHGHPHLLLIRFVREESKKKRRKLQWQHGHPHLLLIRRFVWEETRLLQVSLHERLYYVSLVYCVWQLTEVRMFDVSYNNVWYVLHLFKSTLCKLRFKDNIKGELCKLEFYRPLLNYMWNIMFNWREDLNARNDCMFRVTFGYVKQT